MNANKVTEEKAKEVGERYHHNWIDGTPPSQIDRQQVDLDARKEIDREEKVDKNSAIQFSVPISKIISWFKRRKKK